jgi:hypothetical protein
MMVPAKVKRSTMAAQIRGSVKVLVQPENSSVLDPDLSHPTSQPSSIC